MAGRVSTVPGIDKAVAGERNSKDDELKSEFEVDVCQWVTALQVRSAQWQALTAVVSPGIGHRQSSYSRSSPPVATLPVASPPVLPSLVRPANRPDPGGTQSCPRKPRIGASRPRSVLHSIIGRPLRSPRGACSTQVLLLSCCPPHWQPSEARIQLWEVFHRRDLPAARRSGSSVHPEPSLRRSHRITCIASPPPFPHNPDPNNLRAGIIDDIHLPVQILSTSTGVHHHHLQPDCN